MTTAAERRSYVTFTCDTEGAYPRIFPKAKETCWDVGVIGRTQTGDVGVPLLTEMLERAGARGTFFVDVNAVDYVGDEPVRKTCRELKERGHDVQLHFHSHYEFSDLPNRTALSRAQSPGAGKDFREATLRTADRFEDICGYRSTVYRGGGYHLRSEMLPSLREVGIVAEATVWPDPARRVDLPNDVRWRNRPSWHEGLLILPITHYLELSPGRDPKARQLNFSLDRRRAYEAILDLPSASDLGLISLMSHSSTFMAYGTGPTNKEVAERMLEVHSDRADSLIGSNDWMTSDAPLKLMIEEPHGQRIEEYRDFFDGLAGRPDLTFVTAAEYASRVLSGEIQLPERRTPLHPLPCYDFGIKAARMDYAQRYNEALLTALDREYRDLPEGESYYTRPPDEIASEAKARGIL